MKSNQLEFIFNNNVFNIYFNKVNLGQILKLEDGFYCWFPCEFKGSCLSN